MFKFQIMDTVTALVVIIVVIIIIYKMHVPKFLKFLRLNKRDDLISGMLHDRL